MIKKDTKKSLLELGRDDKLELLKRYGCGSIQFSETDNGLYERHLIFDNVKNIATIGLREKFEAFAHAVRDVLSQRWIQTETVYNRENPKRIYYLSMEFLIGRSLVNNITNILLDKVTQQTAAQKNRLLSKLAF